MKLALATDEEIYTFSLTWGMLGMRVTIFEEDADLKYGSHMAGHKETWKSEPLQVWRLYSRIARAIIRLHDKLRVGDPETSLHDWGALFRLEDPRAFNWPMIQSATECYEDARYSPPLVFRGQRPRPNLEFQRILLEAEITRWFRESRIYPAVTWDNEEMKLGIVGYRRSKPSFTDAINSTLYYDRQDFYRDSEWDLIGVMQSEWEHEDIRPRQLFLNLTIQLAVSLTRPEGTYQCAMCGDMFELENGQKAPSSKKNHYCRKECRDDAHRLVMKRNYHKKKAQGNLPSVISQE